jgi:Zn finger protein HypA/HybF involved in hydrogenase expression
MPLILVQEDSAYKCSKCGHVMRLKKGQLLPPCPRCGGTMESFEGPVPEPKRPVCD